MVAMDISAKKRKRTLLIHLAGSISLTHAFIAEQKCSGDDIDTAMKSLTTYFEPKRIWSMKSENFGKLANAMAKRSILTTLAFDTLLSRCEFADMDREIKTHANCSNVHVPTASTEGPSY